MSLDLILAGVRRWDTARSQDPERDRRVKAQVAQTVAPFLGGSATERVLQPVARDNSNLLGTLEDVMATFLGTRAAAAVISRAMDGVHVRS